MLLAHGAWGICPLELMALDRFCFPGWVAAAFVGLVLLWGGSG